MTNHTRLAKILSMALHPGTPDEEALTSIRLAGKLLSEHGLNIADLVTPRAALSGPGVQTIELSLAVGRLEEQNKALTTEVERLRGEVAEYQRIGLKTKKKPVFGEKTRWSLSDRAALNAMILENPAISNKELAEALTEKLGRTINENMVKGQKNQMDLHRDRRSAA